jgi:DnaK suppressor protein
MISTRQLERLRQQLEEERDRILAESAVLEDIGDDWDGDINGNGDIVDIGTALAEWSTTATLAQNARELVAQIEDALARMDAGIYGQCDACGGEIEVERLEVLPYATLCVADME